MPSALPLDLHTNYAASSPGAQDKVPASNVDADHLAIEAWSAQLLTNLGLVIRDDNTLVDEIVRLRNLHPEVVEALEGLTVLEAADAMSLSNVALAGLLTVDGYTLLSGDRVLLVGQTNGTQNGLWSAAAGAWTRTSDFATGSAQVVNTVVDILNGTTQTGSTWRLSAEVTVDTTTEVWNQLSGLGTVVPIARGGTGATTAAAARTALGSTTVGDALFTAASEAAARNAIGGLTKIVTNLAALKALAGTDLAGTVYMQGFTTAGDGGGGLFRWVAASAATANDGLVVEPTAGGGRFFRIYEGGVVNIKWFGAVGDNTADDTTKIQAAFDASLNVYMPAGTYKTTVKLTFRSSAKITGDGWRNTLIRNSLTDGMGRQGVGTDVRDVILEDFQIAGENPPIAAPGQIGLDLADTSYSRVTGVATRFQEIGYRLTRTAAGRSCYFNKIYSPMCLSNKTGLYLKDLGSGETPNANRFYDVFIEDVGVWSAGNGIDLSGYGNLFDGVYGGLPSYNSVVKIQAIAGNNTFFNVYGESSATYLFDNTANTSLRKNHVYGVHIDSGTMVMRRYTDNTVNPNALDLLIYDRFGHVGLNLRADGAASEIGECFRDGATIIQDEPRLSWKSTDASGKSWDLISGGGAETTAGNFLLRNVTDGRNVVTIGGATPANTIVSDADGTAIGKLKVDVILTASLPAAAAAQNGRIVIEDAGAGDRNLILYAGAQRFRIDGGAAF